MRARILSRGLLLFAALFLLAACGSAPSRSANRSFGGAQVAAEVRSDSWFGGDDDDDLSDDVADAESAPMNRMAKNGGEAAPMQANGPDAPPAPPKKAPSAHDGATGKPPLQSTSPLLIYTANYTMAVYEVTSSIDNVQALAKKMGGYLVRRGDREITVRVPAAKYHNALRGISKLGDIVHHEETVEDVTEQFFDMKTRLDNARAMRVRLQELLAAAKDVNDALAVEKELSRVTETIERMEGKLKRLRELINFSTITVTFAARGGENVNSKVNLPFSWLGQLGLGPLLRLR